MMRELFLDLTRDGTRPIYCFGGYEGEHNATLLRVKLPARMLSPKVAEYRFLFETSKKEAVFSNPMGQSEGEVRMMLPRSLTLSPEVKFHVAAFSYEERELRTLEKSGTVILNIHNPVAEREGQWQGQAEGPQPSFPIVDQTVIAESVRPVAGGAVFKALENKLDREDLQVSDQVTEGDENPVSGAAVFDAMSELDSGGEPLYRAVCGRILKLNDLADSAQSVEIVTYGFEDEWGAGDFLASDDYGTSSMPPTDGIVVVAEYEYNEDSGCGSLIFEDGSTWPDLLTDEFFSPGDQLYYRASRIEDGAEYYNELYTLAVVGKTRVIEPYCTVLVNGEEEISDKNGFLAVRTQATSLTLLTDSSHEMDVTYQQDLNAFAQKIRESNKVVEEGLSPALFYRVWESGLVEGEAAIMVTRTQEEYTLELPMALQRMEEPVFFYSSPDVTDCWIGDRLYLSVSPSLHADLEEYTLTVRIRGYLPATSR